MGRRPTHRGRGQRRDDQYAVSIGWSHDSTALDIRAWQHRDGKVAITPPKQVRTIGQYRWASGALSLDGPMPKPISKRTLCCGYVSTTDTDSTESIPSNRDCSQYKGRFHTH
jgi:hypothetical protein